MTQIETYVIHAKTDGSTMSIATESPETALKHAREMKGPKCVVTISDRNGNVHTIEEMEANVLSGVYAKSATSER